MKEDRVYLKHIRDAIIQINSYTVDGRDSFFHNRMIQDAIILNSEIIGEIDMLGQRLQTAPRQYVLKDLRGRNRVAAIRWHWSLNQISQFSN